MTIRLLRGRVVVREDYTVHAKDYPHIIVPESKHGYDDRHAVARGRTWHIGTVLAKGPPAQTKGARCRRCTGRGNVARELAFGVFEAYGLGEDIVVEPCPTCAGKGRIPPVDVPHGFEVGDKVIFHWNVNEENFTRPWEDGELACWIAQDAVDAVVES